MKKIIFSILFLTVLVRFALFIPLIPIAQADGLTANGIPQEGFTAVKEVEMLGKLSALLEGEFRVRCLKKQTIPLAGNQKRRFIISKVVDGVA